MMLVVSGMASLTYISSAANFPLQDANLLVLDRALGFDFRAYLDFANQHLWYIYFIAAGYRFIFWPIWAIVVLLPLFGHYGRAAEFICAFALALIATDNHFDVASGDRRLWRDGTCAVGLSEHRAAGLLRHGDGCALAARTAHCGFSICFTSTAC